MPTERKPESKVEEDNIFWPPKDEIEAHLYEIRHGKTEAYVLEHAQALRDELQRETRRETLQKVVQLARLLDDEVFLSRSTRDRFVVKLEELWK